MALFACSSGDEEKTPDGSAKYNAIASSVQHPTGTLDTTTAVDVAHEYEKISSTAAGGLREQAASSSAQTVSCPSGGSYSISTSGSGSSGSAEFKYNNCCYAADCCFSGGGDLYYSTAGGSLYSYCATYSLALTCSSVGASAAYSGCFDTSGSWDYVVTVNGKTFTVTGDLYSGTGTLDIRAENGEFTCTYTNYSGSCSGSGSFSF